MRLCYALRRGVYYPSQRDAFGEMPARGYRARYLAAVKSMGFDGVEVPVPAFADGGEREAADLKSELAEYGLGVSCVRAGGPIAHPRDGRAVQQRLTEAVLFASAVGAPVVNSTCVTPPPDPAGPGALHIGETVSQGSSRQAAESDFIATANAYRQVGEMAADHGLDIAIEIHQGSIADNSWSGLHLVELIGLDNVGVNPDLGNIFWQYDQPEETCESAVVALAPKAKYWHCKNLKKVAIPDLHRSIYLRTALPDGDIDYRFAVSAMIDAGYAGSMAIEGSREGDQLTIDARSATYALDLIRSAK